MSNSSINISGVGGDVVGVGVSGSGNIIGKQINAPGGLHLNAGQLARLPDEYASSLREFSEAVNKQLTASRVPAEEIAPVQNEVEALAREVETVKPGQPVPITKKASLTTRLAAVARGLLRILPRTAEAVAAFTPLAPFSKLIGTGVDEVIKSVQEEG